MTIKELYEKAKAEGKEDYEIYYIEDDWSNRETGLNCPKCWGRGEAEITKEEWIRICPTHQLIRILMSVAEGGAMRKESARDFCDEAQRWSLWLKEKHTE